MEVRWFTASCSRRHTSSPRSSPRFHYSPASHPEELKTWQSDPVSWPSSLRTDAVSPRGLWQPLGLPLHRHYQKGRCHRHRLPLQQLAQLSLPVKRTGAPLSWREHWMVPLSSLGWRAFKFTLRKKGRWLTWSWIISALKMLKSTLLKTENMAHTMWLVWRISYRPSK